jgi:hypothetical protein
MPRIEEAFAPGFKLETKENCEIAFYLIDCQSDVLLRYTLIKPQRKAHILKKQKSRLTDLLSISKMIS